MVLLGEPADFTCQTENQTKRFLFWYRNHVSLGVGTTAFAAHARRYQLHISAGETRTNYSLHINAVTWQDDTNFRCVIQAGLADTQSPTETSSRRAQLTVLKPPERLSVRALSLDSQVSYASPTCAQHPREPRQLIQSPPALALIDHFAPHFRKWSRWTQTTARRRRRRRAECR